MTLKLKNLDRIPESMHSALEQYIHLLQQLDGDNVDAVTLFNHIAAGTFNPREHTVRNVLVCKEVNIWKLYHLADHGKRLGKIRIASPLIMTPKYIQASLDTFPLELIDIHQQHVTIVGKDHFAELKFNDSDIRLQCERELKTILIRMRQGLLAAAGRLHLLAEMEDDIMEQLTRAFRGLLWLKGDKEPKPMAEVLAAVEKAIGQEFAYIQEVIARPHERGWDQFRHLYRDIDRLGGIVDAW